MRIVLARCITALLLSFQFLSPLSIFSQEETRQRRAETPVAKPKTSPATVPPQWTSPTPTTVTSTEDPGLIVGKAEPTIRVALATDVRAATISTTGHLMNATDVSSTFVALDVARVRVEPRLLSPLPAIDSEANYRLQIAGLESRSDAEQKSKELRAAGGADSQIIHDSETKTWGLIVGDRLSRDEAESERARLEDAGFAIAIVPPTGTNVSADSLAATPTNRQSSVIRPPVRTVSRASMPSREVVAFGPGAGKLFSSSAPVTFASDDEKAPVRFNDRPYRGRIEVFANTRGALTVVNVLGLEDYVKGVVPNELSAGGFPLIEAHKAQAIAARTYALRNRGQFMSQGYDLLPTTRSQVYRGLSSENSLSSRAVDQTRGIVATYNGEPINALYTSTCGGRTEDSENVFNDAVGYLKARECAAEGRAALAPFVIKTTREPAELKEEHLPLARDVALLSIQNFGFLRPKVGDSWLDDDSEVDEVRSWLATVARLAKQIAPVVTADVHHPPAFATALSTAVFGESRGSTLLNNADIDYFLAVRDANEIPQANRADVAMLIRDGYLSILPDATLRPLKPLSRARALHSIARILDARNLLQLQKGTARPTADNALVLRSTKGKDLPVRVSADAFLFRQIGELIYPVRSMSVVGGEAVVFHVNGSGEVDYLEVKPAIAGAAADRFSPYSNWTAELSLGQVQARLGRYASRIGSLVDLRVLSRGRSGRATDLELVGTNASGHVRGGRIRSALGLREQLFVIERKYDETGRVTGFAFIGRGWGHGVGMCQVGAYGLARQGFTHDQILKAYYTGIELTRIY
ncbi:MAG: SpoIID/LytB domain-containing protein [Acidobacteriota bacterium]|nr:SpoIID/LytB domain-containing protein [Acidobacteriota bacterium]